ncbi:MAG: WYL domain-containing protein [Tannerellaceae bacterium]|jgi:predicted DNA-binding transcriptional regulator YafY|nr:WYL domain-containing protein [Tannerellaceae bacterium]
MAKIDTLRRLLLIVNKLDGGNKYVHSSELLAYVEQNMRIRNGTAPYSLRTIQRDIKDIDDLFGIVIKHKKDAGYYITEREQASPEKYEELLYNFDILAALDAESGLSNYVLAEHHRPTGSTNLIQLMDAIRTNYHVEFDYTLFRHDNKIQHKRVAPHFLKESQQRWYLLAIDEGKLKLFSVDRISNLSCLTEDLFKRDKSIDVENLFKDSFGIWNQEDIPVENVVLSYDALDGKFLKTVPLHHSQTILTDTENEFRIKIHLRITNDFVMELLSRSRSLTVIEPLSLRKQIHDVYTNAIKRNS